MEFHSMGFIALIAILFFLYWNVGQSLKNGLLTAFSLLFYLSLDWRLLPVAAVTAVLAWYLGILLEEQKSRALYVGGIILILLPLLFFKYFNFLSGNVAAMLQSFSLPIQPRTIEMAMPVGISFYTFSIVGYLTDIYRGRMGAERSFWNGVLFILYFPKLVSGPIVRGEDFFRQIRGEKKFDYDQAAYGLRRILWGAYKKFVVADTLALGVNTVYGDLRSYSGMVLLIVTFMYTIQIYCDFSGYTDMVLGISRLFAIDLVENFRAPYFSKSIREFWGRWHISLSTWLRDYIYIPLGGNRNGRARQALHILATFLVSGIWHGASWTFVAWGGLHGIFQIGERLTEGGGAGGRKAGGKTGRLVVCFKILSTFLIVNFLWVFFRAETFSDAFYVFDHMLRGFGAPAGYLREFAGHLQITPGGILVLLAETALVAVYDLMSGKRDIAKDIKRLPFWMRHGLYAGMAVLILLLYPKEAVGNFIYVQF